ncbi:SPOC domain-like protein [Suhomyces tanzawaensis NRRL Y-17324]|uniref:ATP-dependent DNA helicase II subunit 1 n=1 Tax=Suhomyces tanzawaensis NRRL Y-17324 TaxID=984487 RepID=A0A1E4SEH8_9ASCO|nr:SPOC domain-like protein [Suhomyces tanzawaensis NRRL Y-17324]ODV77924.1 SPOC domain-like protein [Suhomyces tanzawaensis NRRL Y-17324]
MSQYEVREGIIFLIELTPTILEPLADLLGKSILFEILSSINDLMSELIISMKSTGVGIYFYNCDETAVEPLKLMKVPGFQKLFRLNQLNLTNMKILNDMITDEAQGVRPLSHFFKASEPSQTPTSLPSVLTKTLDEFMDKKYFNRRKLIWLTSNDKPFTKTSSKESLWRIVNDFYNYGYFILPMFLGQNFDVKCYRDVFINTNFLTEHSPASQNPAGDTADNQEPKSLGLSATGRGFRAQSKVFSTTLASQIRTNIYRVKEIRRMQFACDLILSDGPAGAGLGCTIKGYTIYSPEKIKKDLLLYTGEETLKRVFTESKVVGQGGVTVEDKNVRKGYEIGGGQVLYLDEDQQNYIKGHIFDHEPKHIAVKEDLEVVVDEDESSGDEEAEPVPSISNPPYLKLLGFRALSSIQPAYNSTPPIFITPDLTNGLKSSGSAGYNNSFSTFSSLYQSCVKLSKMAIVFGCTKKNSKPSLFALYPTKTVNASRNVPGEDELPEGFLLIRLPWLEDVRSLPNYYCTKANDDESAVQEAPASLINSYKELLSQFFYKHYNPRDFSNPTLNYFYKVIKHDLLQISLPESEKSVLKNDITSMKLGQLRAFLNEGPRGDLIAKLNESLNELEQTLPKKEVVEPAAKRPKVDAPALDEGAVLTAWKNDQWGHFTVVQLKGFQRAYKDEIKGATKKADLIENIKSFLDNRAKRQ